MGRPPEIIIHLEPSTSRSYFHLSILFSNHSFINSLCREEDVWRVGRPPEMIIHLEPSTSRQYKALQLFDWKERSVRCYLTYYLGSAHIRFAGFSLIYDRIHALL